MLNFIDAHICSPPTSYSLCSVSWVKGADSEDSTLLAQDNDGHISYYSVFRNDSANVEINRLTHCHRNTLKSLLSEWVTGKVQLPFFKKVDHDL